SVIVVAVPPHDEVPERVGADRGVVLARGRVGVRLELGSDRARLRSGQNGDDRQRERQKPRADLRSHAGSPRDGHLARAQWGTAGARKKATPPERRTHRAIAGAASRWVG